ncbi:MAG: sensor histidine kinase [Verrucomicrobia bacterium]|nr:sensor histidine kinase [Verrucomicrobiota bacterium]
MKLFAPAFAFAALLASGPRPCVRAQLLTKAIEVRSLSVAQAQQGLDAQLRGTVIFFEPTAVFVQDDTSTTFFRPKALGALRLGDEIEVKGRTQPGLFQPGIGPAEHRILGHGPLPEPISASYDDLESARFHYQRVAVEGVVRSLAPFEEGRSLLRLALGSRVMDVRIDAPPDRERTFVDSRVRVRGLAAGFINDRRQLVQPYVRVQDWTEIAILDTALAPAAVPLVSAAGLFAFRLSGHGERRVRVEGVVTAAFPRGVAFIRQGRSAFGVKLGEPATLQPGDRVELLGFPAMDRFSASVVDAELLRRDPGPPPAPVEVGEPDGLMGLHDGNLVAVTAILTDAFRTDGGIALVLQGKARTIQARIPDLPVVPAVGSRVRVTGACLVESNELTTGFSTRPTVVSLRARNAEDVAVLQSPPWWTARRLGAVLAMLAGVTLLAGLWIAALRRQVSRQTAALRRRIESEATLEERQRIAREFHDTLEQELAGVSLRLDALATRSLDEKGRSLIAASRNLVTRIQTETRDLISDLRDPTETAGDLATALAAVAARQSADSGVEVRFEPAANIPPLAAATVHDLRMIAREAVTNAIKHGRATHVTIALETRATQLAMTIVDNGCGFDAATALQGKRGHFGCAGIRERSRKIGAQIAWRSVLQKGATVEVALPLRGHERPQADEADVAGGVSSPRIDASAV